MIDTDTEIRLSNLESRMHYLETCNTKTQPEKSGPKNGTVYNEIFILLWIVSLFVYIKING